MREIRTYGLKRGIRHRRVRGGNLYSTVFEYGRGADIRSGDTVDVALDNALENHDLALDSAGRREARKRIFAMIRGLHMGQLNGNSCDDLVAAGVMSEVQAMAFLKRFGVPGFDESMMRNGGAALRSAGLSGRKTAFVKALVAKCDEIRSEVVDEFRSESASVAMSRIVRWVYDSQDSEAFADGMKEDGLDRVLSDRHMMKDLIRGRAMVCKLIEDEFGPKDDEEVDRLISYGKYFLHQIDEFLMGEVDFPGPMGFEDLAIAKEIGSRDSDDWETTVCWLMNARLIVPSSVVNALWERGMTLRAMTLSPREWTGAVVSASDAGPVGESDSVFIRSLRGFVQKLEGEIVRQYDDPGCSAPMSRLVCWMAARLLSEESVEMFRKDAEKISDTGIVADRCCAEVARADDNIRRILTDTFHPVDEQEMTRHMDFAEELVAEIFEFLERDFRFDVTVADVEYLGKLASVGADGWLNAIAWIARDLGVLPDSVKLELWGEDAVNRSLAELSKAMDSCPPEW